MKRLLIAALLIVFSFAARAEEITVFAASSLKTALDRVAANWQAQSGVQVVLAYDGSGRLAQQILNGAPADLFISASGEWMDAAEPALQVSSRRDLLGNDLVLIGAGKPEPQVISAALDLGALLGVGRLAIGQTTAVPAGQYGRQALEALGLWDGVDGRLAEGDSARAALDLVARGETPLGVVFGSDLMAGQAAELDIGLIGGFPPDSHAPILYPAALLKGSGPQASAFLDYLGSQPAQEIFVALGFTRLAP